LRRGHEYKDVLARAFMTTKVGQAVHLRDVGTSEVQGILNNFKEC